MTLSLAARSEAMFHEDQQNRIRATLSSAAVFRDIPAAVLDDLARRVIPKRVLAGHAVVSQDEVGDALYVLMAGRAKVVVAGDNGREVTLAVLRPGDIFGELALFDGSGRSASIMALDPVTALALRRDDLLRHLVSHPETAVRLIAELARRLRRADETIAELALCGVNDRLIRALVRLARDEGVELPEGVLIRRRPTQQDLASMVGSSRETVSRAMSVLARGGLVRPRGRAMVISPKLLAAPSAAQALSVA